MEKRLINSEEARHYLGGISKATFWRWKKKKGVKPLNGTHMYLPEDIEKIAKRLLINKT